MQLVERHLIKKSSHNFSEIDFLCFQSKNLYNKANFIQRQQFFNIGKFWAYSGLYHEVKNELEYNFLPTKVSQQTLKVLASNWKAWINATKAYKKDPSVFTGKPKMPKYLDKNGRFPITYTRQAISFVNSGYIKLSQTNIQVKTQVDYKQIQQVRIVPKGTVYYIEVVYNQDYETNHLDYDLVAGIDLGLNNLATITSNKVGFVPFFINGRPLKSLNQYYNKIVSKHKSELPTGSYYSKKLDFITQKRNRRIDNYLHKASRYIVNSLVKNGIGNLVIGLNKGWKQEINIGKKNNQHFVSIPHSKLIQMITYKAEIAGIIVRTTEESYTSKCSFLDNEVVGKHDCYLGKRTGRGMFVSSKGIKINADVNGSYNIIKKVFPNAFANGIEDAVVHPVKVNLQR